MRHYARERDRCQRRVDELEQRKYVCEADMAAMDVCWTQVGGGSGLAVHRLSLIAYEPCFTAR